jgi:peptidoglycan hydrolase-like protein with peptidoglycan-binding domain
MTKIIKLTESDLEKIIKKVLKEDEPKLKQTSNVGENKIKVIQNALIRAGYSVGPTGADGSYGPNTMNAVKKYQRDNGIKQTGFVGDVTSRKLGVPSMSSGASQTKTGTTGGKTQTASGGKTQTASGGKTQTASGGQSKVTSKDPSDINSYPACVRFGKPNTSASGVYKLLNNLGANYGQWQIAGKNFYEGYFFFNNGKYVSLLSNKTGTYFCNAQNKLILDIAAKASDPNTKKSGNYKYSPRIDAEVQHIKNRKMDDTPFLIYDPKDNLIYLFNTGAVYVTSSSVVDGADAQKGLSDAKAFTREDWCKISNMESKPELCTDPKTGTKTKPFYGPIANLSSRFLPKGIYTINGLIYNEGYVGGSRGGAKNQFGLEPIKLEGTITAAAQKGLSAAIHGIPGESGRLKASKELETALKADVNSGKVPPQYLDNIKAILDANRSFGCIGVPASFVNNPKVQSIISANVNKIKVFAMGEDSQDFLVKNDSQKSDDQRNLA